MKRRSLKFKYIPEKINHLKRTAVGAQFYAVCPFCKYGNSEWAGTNTEPNNTANRLNKCEHFVKIEAGRFHFVDGFDLLPAEDEITAVKMCLIDGVKYPIYVMIESLKDVERIDPYHPLVKGGFVKYQNCFEQYLTNRGKDLLNKLYKMVENFNRDS